MSLKAQDKNVFIDDKHNEEALIQHWGDSCVTISKSDVNGYRTFYIEKRIKVLHCNTSSFEGNYGLVGLTDATISNCKMKSGIFIDSSSNLSFKSNDNDYRIIGFINSIIFYVSFSGDTIGNLKFDNCNFKNNPINFDYCYLKNGIVFEDEVPEIINFENVKIEGEIKFFNCRIIKPIIFSVTRDFPFSSINLGYSKFDLDFKEEIGQSERIAILRQILETQKRIGLAEDIEKVDIEIKNLMLEQKFDFNLWFQRFLWNFGYDKTLLIERLLTSFMIFYFFNIVFFKRLATKVYNIKNIAAEFYRIESNAKSVYLMFRYYMLVFIYSSLIFFGLKMDLDRFNFAYLPFTLYLMTFYLIGIIFLFYLVGLILIR